LKQITTESRLAGSPHLSKSFEQQL